MEIKKTFYINLYLKDRLDIEFTACLGDLTHIASSRVRHSIGHKFK